MTNDNWIEQQLESPCEHKFTVALWRCLRNPNDVVSRPLKGLHVDWEMDCLDCNLFDFPPSEAKTIMKWNRKDRTFVEWKDFDGASRLF